MIVLAFCLVSCLVKEEEKRTVELHVSEPIAQVSYAVAFNRADIRLAEEFDKVLGEVLADGTAGKLSEVHFGKDMTPKEPISASIARGEDDSLDRVREAGKLVVGYQKQNPPQSWIDSAGKAVGFDSELIKEVGRRMGLPVEFVIIEWGRADAATESDTMDAVISMEYTSERAKNLNLTRTYLDSSIVIISREDTPYNTIDELFEKTVGVCDSAYLNALTADSGAKIKNYSSTVNAYQQLRARRADAIIADSKFVDYQKNGYAD